MSLFSNPQASAAVQETGDPSTPGFIVVDASVWVSRLVPQDAFHLLVKRWMEKQRAEGVTLLSPTLLLPEVGGAISRRTGEPQLGRNAIDQLARLPGLKLVEMDHSLVQQAARLASDLGLRGADSLYVGVATRLKLSLVTLDEDQKSKASSAVAVYSLEQPEH
jgi:predicted nucleic acid-binding protein